MQVTIRNASGEQLDYAFHAAGDTKERIVLIGHGVTGNKDRAWSIALAEGLAEAGVPALRFSFAGNGDSEGDFRACTVSKEVEDLGAVIDAVATEGYEEIVYAGHSMGGAVGVLRTATDTRINRLISLAGMVETAKFYETEFGEEIPDEGLMWEKPDCPLSSAFVEDMKAIGDVLPQGESISVPWLLVHGTEDDVVPIDESRAIRQVAAERPDYVELPGSDHIFSGDAEASMVQAVVNWLR